MIVTGLGGLFLTAGTASADVTSVRGTGFGISATAAGASLIPATPDPTQNPPLLVANESSTDFGPHTSSVVTIGGILGVLNNGISVGPVSTQAGNIVGNHHNGFISTSSQVANISALSDAIDIPLITSSCISNGDGSSGTTNVSNAKIGTSQLLNGPVAPNTTINVLGLATVVLNEQIISNTPPVGSTPGTTSITVNAAHIRIPADGSIADIILAQSQCSATGPDVLVPQTTTTTAPATTTTTAPATTTTTVAGTTTTTAPATTTTTAPATTTTTAAPTTTTLAPTTTVVVTVTVPPTTAPPGVLGTVLARTGLDLQPIAALSVLSIVLGILILIGSGQPVAAGAGRAAGYTVDGQPENWGPAEIVKTIWAGLAALMLALIRPLRRRRG
jgi:hypothetical protein